MAVSVLGPAGFPQEPRLPGGNRAQGPYSSLGPGGYSRPPYADFSAKVGVKSGFFSALGAGGYPHRPYVTSLFGTKVTSGATTFPQTITVACTSTTTAWRKAVGKATTVACTSTTSLLKQIGKRITVACTSTTTIAATKARLLTIGVTCTSTTSMLTSVTRAPVTGGAGGELPRRGYTWKWSDFNDQAWFRAFREEFYRVKRLKNAKQRRQELVKLEKTFKAAVEEHTGERLTGTLPDTEFYDHVAEGLALLAAEIEDEEAFLLLN